jgi:cell wall-associated NlpC family hydrolase
LSRRVVVVLLSVFAAVTVGASTWGGTAKGATYEQVVDNSDEGRFAASGSWKTSDSGEGINGDDYRFALPSDKAANAMFKVNIPADGEYAIYARWPEVPGLNDKARVGVETAYGTQWREVDQRRDGGNWVRIGRFELREGDEYSVKISRDTEGEGNVVADAVKVSTITSYEEPPSEPPAQESTAGTSAEQRTASATGATSTGAAVVQRARSFKNKGIKYAWGACSSERYPRYMSCTCLTKKSFAPFGYNLSMDEANQARAGRPVSRAELRPGDLVYFREYGGRITHVGIYSKPGYLVHASDYWNGIKESQMKYIRGYAGARRLV